MRNPSTKFVYRDRLWQGADMAGLGVASFGHMNGVHLQNLDSRTRRTAATACRRAPSCRSRARPFAPPEEEKLIREFVLQLKLGAIRPSYFQGKYGVAVLDQLSRRHSRRSPPRDY